MKLNLGSYTNPLPGYSNIDIEKWDDVDTILDLNKLPYPFASNSIEEIRAVDIIEHLGELTKVEIIKEWARILKPGGKLYIHTANATGIYAFASLQHAHCFMYNSFEPSYAQPYFEVEQIWLGFGDSKRMFKINKLLREISKYTPFIGSIAFLLKKK